MKPLRTFEPVWQKVFLLITLIMVISINAFPQLLVPVKEPGKMFGFIDAEGNYVIQPMFEEAWPFYGDYSIVKSKGKYGVIDKSGNFIISPDYKAALPYFEEDIFILKKDMWGALNSKGRLILPFSYYYLSVVKDSVAIVGLNLRDKKNKQRIYFGVIDSEAQFLFNENDYYSDASAVLPYPKDKKTGITPGHYPKVQNELFIMEDAFAEGSAKTSLVSLKGTANPLPYDMTTAEWADAFRLGILAVNSKADIYFWSPYDGEESLESYNEDEGGTEWSGLPPGQKGYYVKPKLIENEFYVQYEPLNDQTYNKVYPFYSDIAAVEKLGNWAFVDSEGWLVYETSVSAEAYRNERPQPREGLMPLYEVASGLGGYISLKGEIIAPFKYQEIYPFWNGYALVRLNGFYGLIDRYGNEVVPCRFEKANWPEFHH